MVAISDGWRPGSLQSRRLAVHETLVHTVAPPVPSRPHAYADITEFVL